MLCYSIYRNFEAGSFDDEGVSAFKGDKMTQDKKLQNINMEDRKMAKKKDLLIILALLILAGGIWFFFQWTNEGQVRPGAYGVIHYGQDLIKVVPLYTDQIFSVDSNPNVIFKVQEGSIAFSKSDCPDQVCVHTGFIDRSYHFAACLPNLLLLTIREEEE